MAFLKTQKQVQTVNWGRTHLWDVRFRGTALNDLQPPPSPFNDWFPANDVDNMVLALDSHTIDTPLRGYKLPKSSGAKEIKLTFYDDENGTLEQWLEEWVNEKILHDEYYVEYLENCVLALEFLRLRSSLKTDPISTTENIRGRPTLENSQRTYLVYPEGTLSFHGDSDANIHTYNMNFVICGRLLPKRPVIPPNIKLTNNENLVEPKVVTPQAT